MTTDLFLIALGMGAGACIAILAAHLIYTREIDARDADAQAELKRAIDAREYWKHEAARLRASLDGAASYHPRMIRR